MAEPSTTLELAEHMLRVLHGMAPAEGHEHARAMIASATTFLRERFGDVHAITTADTIIAAVAQTGVLDRCQPSPAGLH